MTKGKYQVKLYTQLYNEGHTGIYLLNTTPKQCLLLILKFSLQQGPFCKTAFQELFPKTVILVPRPDEAWFMWCGAKIKTGMWKTDGSDLLISGTSIIDGCRTLSIEEHWQRSTKWIATVCFEKTFKKIHSKRKTRFTRLQCDSSVIEITDLLLLYLINYKITCNNQEGQLCIFHVFT